MNYIQINAKEAAFYTSLRDVAKWLEIDLRDYDWHISDIEGAWYELDDPSWISGKDLAAKIKEFDYQFVWAVISAFPIGTEPFTTNIPYADGNPTFWEGEPQKQISNSLFEIVCWDSSATLFIGMQNDLEEKLLVNAPSLKKLDTKNERCKY
ncbi:hypothetical protein GCM10007938_06120 [Vibrio zhanjiangensis]|uniref:DUF2750 domain-containing protein n=1 Tax=Vibrio zhanjiangensis TaxID=1046128 RepID=A0ABQ6EWE2_9VIBR|nr:hypothetical protein [Vibrio zhanjiangensis]GLT16835.1 hypothetical protein GCM10007938_06120 [Vibrio zhanjiangensis]